MRNDKKTKKSKAHNDDSLHYSYFLKDSIIIYRLSSSDLDRQ